MAVTCVHIKGDGCEGVGRKKGVVASAAAAAAAVCGDECVVADKSMRAYV